MLKWQLLGTAFGCFTIILNWKQAFSVEKNGIFTPLQSLQDQCQATNTTNSNDKVFSTANEPTLARIAASGDLGVMENIQNVIKFHINN